MVEEVPPAVVAKSTVDLITNPEWRANGAGSTASEFAENPAFADPRMLDKFGLFVDPATEVAKFDFSGVAALPEMQTADLAKAVDRFVTEFAQPYDANKDGVFAGKELHDLAGAIIDKAGQMAPTLVANRETILGAIDRVGSVSTEQLKTLVKEAAAMADANGDGKVDVQEYQNLLRATADKTLQR